MKIPNIRLLNQQLISPQFTEVHDLVSWMGMLQAQEYKMMRWAVGVRMHHPSMEAFTKAYNEGSIIRAHLFRCTWQLVAAEDFRWMQKLCYNKNITAINTYTEYYGRKISEKEYQCANKIIESAFQRNHSVTKEALLARLQENGISPDQHTLSIMLRRAEFEGITCSGDLDKKHITYSLAKEKIPTSPELTREESIVLLAKKYFLSHSPATLEDFIWWTNLNVSDCRMAIDALRGQLITENFDGTTYFIHQECRTSPYRKETILLPPYDEYLLGYKSRHHVIEDQYHLKAYSNNGIFHPVVLHDGKIIGNWNPKKNSTFFEDRFAIETEPLRKQYLQFIQ